MKFIPSLLVNEGTQEKLSSITRALHRRATVMSGHLTGIYDINDNYFLYLSLFFSLTFVYDLADLSGRKCWKKANCKCDLCFGAGWFNARAPLRVNAAIHPFVAGQLQQTHTWILCLCKITMEPSNPVLRARFLQITLCWYILLGSEIQGLRDIGQVPSVYPRAYLTYAFPQLCLCVDSSMESPPLRLTIKSNFAKPPWNTHILPID